jgi:hemerythrin-like metal-binding protein
MKLLKWKDEYSMNELEIDKQHKQLFELSNEIYKLVEKGVDDKEHFRNLFVALNDYSIEHFIYEEIYIQEEGFPGLEEHIEQHLQFNKRLQKLIEQEQHIEDIGAFVTSWLIKHVIEEDMKYKKFILDK